MFNVATSTLSKTQAIAGEELSPINKYTSRQGKLYSNDIVLTDANEVLFQCEVDGVDLVVVRDGYNSFSNPIRILAALSGHPVQVSKIVLLKASNNKILFKREIMRKAAAYHWAVRVFQ